MLTEGLHTANQQKRFLGKAAAIANIILGGGGVASLLALLYFFYHYGWTGERKFDSPLGVVLYYLVPAGVAALLFASLKLKADYKINLATLSVSLAASVLGVELFLQLSNPLAPELAVWQVQGQSKEKKQRTREFARQYGVDFDTRDGSKSWTNCGKAASTRSRTLANGLTATMTSGTGNRTVKSNRLSRLPAKRQFRSGPWPTEPPILCNESGQWITYLSDEHGFSNPKGIWRSNPLD